MIKKISVPTPDGKSRTIEIRDEVALDRAKEALKAAKRAMEKAHRMHEAALANDSYVSDQVAAAYNKATNALTKADTAKSRADAAYDLGLVHGNEKYMLSDWFSEKGMAIDIASGDEIAQTGYFSTPFLYLDKTRPLIVKVHVLNSYAAFALYDKDKNFIGAENNSIHTFGAYVSNYDFLLPVDKMPTDAVYFRCSRITSIDGYYTNGSIATYHAFLADEILRLRKELDELKSRNYLLMEN